MNQKLLSSFISILDKIDFFDLYRELNPKTNIIILEYHRVGPVRDIWSLPPVDPHEFESQIAYLKYHYNIIPLDKLVDNILNKITLAKKTAVITFDDGYKDIFEYAYPILKKWNLPATVFLTTGHIGTGDLFWWDKLGYIIWNSKLKSIELEPIGFIDLISKKNKLMAINILKKYVMELQSGHNNKFLKNLIDCFGLEIPDNVGRKTILSWEDIKEMNQGNINFGAHTVTHPILTNASSEQVRSEIINSKISIENELNNKVTSFSYPNGKMRNCNENIINILANNGFISAVTTIPQRIDLNSNVFELGRVPVGWDLSSFKFFSSGFYIDFRKIFFPHKYK